MIVKAVLGRRNINVGRICWKAKFWAWSERVKDDESGGDNNNNNNNTTTYKAP